MNVIVKAKQLVFHTYDITAKRDRYPKKFRHSLCDQIQIKCLQIYNTLVEANRIYNRSTDKEKRCQMITRVITYCDEFQMYIELSMHLGLLGGISVEYWSGLVTEIKKMSIAWRKSEQK